MNHAEGSKDRWTFEYYYPLWQPFHAAVIQAVPHARFAGPDIAKEYSWVLAMAAEKAGHRIPLRPLLRRKVRPADPNMTLRIPSPSRQ